MRISHADLAVVFDCNIYLDVADAFRTGLDLENLLFLSQDHANRLSPPAKYSVDALIRASTGRVANDIRLVTFTSEHILLTSLHKAQLPDLPHLPDEQRGLGLDTKQVDDLEHNLIRKLVAQSTGALIPEAEYSVEQSPPLDHEDGRVYGLCKFLATHVHSGAIYLVTQDAKFVAASRRFPASNIQVVPPQQFLDRCRQIAVLSHQRSGRGPHTLVQGRNRSLP